ncbi:MAG: hypothetical protein NTV81_00615 [Candidatus Komeilibacteria bacterium]|nr:hypothetical protein [Candidatus Komeilibacteria bacterium]
MKWSKSISTGLLTQATSGAASAGQDSQPAGESQVGSKALLRLVVVGLVLVAGLAAWLFWNWYSSGYQRDQVRLQHLQQLMVFLQNYQSQTAVFPFSHNWSEFVGFGGCLAGTAGPVLS